MSLLRARVGGLIKSALAQGSVTLLIAPPGFGKTIALRDTIGGLETARWIELTPGVRFEDLVRVLIEATAPAHVPALASLFDGAGKARDPRAIFEWAEARLRAFEGTLVVDDLHRCVDDGVALEFVVRLIEATSGDVKWVFASREVPAMPIGTWIARGIMALPITDDELAFDVAEATALAAEMNVTIDADVLAAIVEDSNGWPMAVHLALQLWERTRSLAPLRIRTREVLFSQIEAEVWPVLDEDVREIITACALLPEANAAVLSAAGFFNAETLLERAHRSVPFVQKKVGGGYALHDLFQEFIELTIRREPQRTADLRRRLADALHEAQNYPHALRMLVASGDVAGTLRVLAENGFEATERGHRGSIADAISFLRDAGQQNNPIVAALRGAMSFADGSVANAEALFTFAFERGLPAGMRAETGRRLALVHMNKGEGQEAVAVLEPIVADASISGLVRIELRSNLCAAYAVAGEGDQARDALAQVLGELAVVEPTRRAAILQRLAFACYFLGDFARAADYARDSAHLAESFALHLVAARAYSVLYSIASLVESDSSVPLAYARLVTSAAERAGDTSLRAMGLRGAYVLHADRGDWEATETAEAALAGLNDVRSFRDMFAVRIARALADSVRGFARRAAAALERIDDGSITEPERALKDSFLALTLILDDRRAESLALIKAPPLVAVREDFASRRYLNLAHAVRGIALWHHDRAAQARRSFSFDEGGLAERDRILLTTVAEICSKPRSFATRENTRDALDRLREYGWGAYAILFEVLLAKDDGAVVLTPAEMKTLRAFRHGGNQEEVARALGKSPHTIEAQLKSAYRKIGCTSRSEALVYARSRGWLDDAMGIPEIR